MPKPIDHEPTRKALALSGEVIRRVGLLLLRLSVLDEPLTTETVEKILRAMLLLERHATETRALLQQVEAPESRLH